MDFYSQIPTLATSFGCTPDDIIYIFALLVHGAFVCVGVAIDFVFRLGGHIISGSSRLKKK